MGANSESISPFNSFFPDEWSVDGMRDKLEEVIVKNQPWMDVNNSMEAAKWSQNKFHPLRTVKELSKSLDRIKSIFSHDLNENLATKSPQSILPSCKIGVSIGAFYSYHFFNHLFSTVLKETNQSNDKKCEFFQLPINIEDLQNNEFDFMIFSVLDGWSKNEEEEDVISPSLLLTLSSYRYYSPQSTIILISGEPINLSSLPSQLFDILFHTTSDDQYVPHSEIRSNSIIYLPNFVTAYAEGEFHTKYPTNILISILEGRDHELHEKEEKESSVAYLYSKCKNRDQREKLVTFLEDHSPISVSKLGVCQGFGNEQDESRLRYRFQSSSSYLEEAVQIYSKYKFMISSEHTNIEGYITEKILMPFLSSSLPIIVNSNRETIDKYFNTEGMIFCEDNHYENCIQEIEDVVNVPIKYQSKIEKLYDYEENKERYYHLKCLFDWLPHVREGIMNPNQLKDPNSQFNSLMQCKNERGETISLVDQFRQGLERIK